MSIQINEVRNAKYTEDGSIDLEINHPEHGWIPYLLTDYDEDMTIDNNQLRLVIGDNVSPYEPPTQDQLDAWASVRVRNERDRRLTNEVDPIVTNPLRWAALSVEKQNEWSAYRTALLDITDQDGFPQNVIWPNKPE